jgi:hypothetical protein
MYLLEPRFSDIKRSRTQRIFCLALYSEKHILYPNPAVTFGILGPDANAPCHQNTTSTQVSAQKFWHDLG